MMITLKKHSNRIDYTGRSWYFLYKDDQPVMEKGTHVAYHALDENHALAMHTQLEEIRKNISVI